MASKLQNMYIQLVFSPKTAKLLIREQGVDNSDRLRVLTNKNVDDICNVMRKLGSKNANGSPNRGRQVSVIAQENLKLAAFLFHHQWRCTLDWEIMGLKKGKLCFVVGQKKLKDDYKDPNVMPKIYKPNMAGTMEFIKEYLRVQHGVIKAPSANVIRKTITIQTYGD